MKSDDRIGDCAICGTNGPLSKEHMPPRKAFNLDTVLMAHIDEARTRTEVRWRAKQRQGGYHEYRTCVPCNNKTGKWYGTAYVDFVRECARVVDSVPGAHAAQVTFPKLRPSRVAKQALATLCAACGPSLRNACPELEKLILDPESRGLPPRVRLLAYLRAEAGGRTSGIAGIADVESGGSRVVAEFSWWPVGWILAFDDASAGIEAKDLSDWASFGFHDVHPMTIELPRKWAVTAYPLDFRDPAQVRREADAARRKT